MKTLLHNLFIKNWPRKITSLGLGIFIWIMVNHSITITKTFHDVKVQVSHIPKGKTIEGLTKNNYLLKRITLTITGNKKVLEELSGSDLTVLIDARGKGGEWILSVTPEDLICINPNVDLQKSITKIISPNLIIKLKNKDKKENQSNFGN